MESKSDAGRIRGPREPVALWTKTDREVDAYTVLHRHLARGDLLWRSRPFHIEFSLNNLCNLRCPSCPQSVKGMVPRRSMPLDLAERILDEILPHASVLTPSAGSEPMLGEYEFMVRKAREHRTFLNIITNATLMTPEIFEDSADIIYRVQLSIDSNVPEVFEDLRRPAKFERVLANARGITAAANARSIPVWYTLVLSRRNYTHLAEYISWVARLGGRAVQVLELLENTPACSELRVPLSDEVLVHLDAAAERATREEIDLTIELPHPYHRAYRNRPPRLRMIGPDILQVFHDRLFREYPGFCYQAATYIRVDPDGNLYPCCRSGKELFIGNLRETSFAELWNSAPYRRLRMEMHHGQPNPVCARCSVLTYFRAAAEELDKLRREER